ncbi:unnamed protein product [Umbelopsis vinacea]
MTSSTDSQYAPQSSAPDESYPTAANVGEVGTSSDDSKHAPSNLLVLNHLDLIRRAEKMRIPQFNPGDDVEIWLKRYDAITTRRTQCLPQS